MCFHLRGTYFFIQFQFQIQFKISKKKHPFSKIYYGFRALSTFSNSKNFISVTSCENASSVTTYTFHTPGKKKTNSASKKVMFTNLRR